MINDPSIHEIRFDKILADFTERIRNGDDPGISEYLRDYPELAEQINELFPLILQLEGEKGSGVGNKDKSRWKLPTVGVMGDYSLIREIGRGGMGVVYEARQSSLERRVALKVLKDEQALSPKNLARFQREGRMTAMLHHANIVPVFGTGSENGTSYIVMQMIDGVGLDQIIDHLVGDWTEIQICQTDQTTDSVETTLDKMVVDISRHAILKNNSQQIDWKKFASLAVQISSALSHAHSRLVIHRDIKPSNLIVDRAGKPWVVDFGLARTFQTEDDVTRVVGTPRYMAPEQIAGNATAASDLFGLGLTLYELAGRVRVFEQDPDEESFADQPCTPTTVGRLVFTPRPKQTPLLPLRQVVSDIPQDLETVIMKCVAIDPKDRYPDSEALTEDLERFLDNRPLATVKVPVFDRVKRWSQRNPQTAIVATIAAMLLAGIAGVSSVSYWKEHAQRTKTEETLRVSMETLDKVYDRLAPDENSRQPLSDANAQLLNDLLASYDELGRLDGSNLELQMTAANANFRVGEIHRRLGNRREALLALDKSIRLHRALAEENPGIRGQAMVQIVRSMISQGATRSESGRLDRGPLEASLAVMDEANDLANLAEKERLDLRFERARALFLLGISPKRRPGDFDAQTLMNDASSTQPNEYLSRAIGILEQWSSPQPAKIKSLLAQCYGERSSVFDDTDSRRSIELQESLVSEFPESIRFRTNLADALCGFDPLELTQKHYPKAVTLLKNTVRIGANLDLNDRRVRNIVKHTHHKLALMFGRLSEEQDLFSNDEIEIMLGNASRNALDEAIKHARKAVEVNELASVQTGTDGQRDSAGRSAWVLRFRATLCDLLWSRNLGTDRREVAQIIEQCQSDAGAINLSTPDGKTLAQILDQLTTILDR